MIKSIVEQFPTNKITGIYRIFIKVGKHEFCFVSYAKNIYGSVKEHRNGILKHFNESKLTNTLLQEYALPEKNKALFHFSIFLVAKMHGLSEDDIKYEILEETNTLEIFELDSIEQRWIDEFQCEKYGFNSPFKYLEKFVKATMHNIECEIEHYRLAWSKTQENIEGFAAHDQRHIDNKNWFKNPTNAFVLLDRGYISDSSNWFKQEWKNTFDKIIK